MTYKDNLLSITLQKVLKVEILCGYGLFAEIQIKQRLNSLSSIQRDRYFLIADSLISNA